MSIEKVIYPRFYRILSVHLRYSKFLPIICIPIFQVGVQTKPEKEMSFHASVDMNKKLIYRMCGAHLLVSRWCRCCALRQNTALVSLAVPQQRAVRKISASTV
jgi:hypothetical protein